MNVSRRTKNRDDYLLPQQTFRTCDNLRKTLKMVRKSLARGSKVFLLFSVSLSVASCPLFQFSFRCSLPRSLSVSGSLFCISLAQFSFPSPLLFSLSCSQTSLEALSISRLSLTPILAATPPLLVILSFYSYRNPPKPRTKGGDWSCIFGKNLSP